MPLVNCEVSLTLNWSKNYVLTYMKTDDFDPNPDFVVAEMDALTNATFFYQKSKIVCFS